MALGKKLIVWDAEDMIKGVSTSDDLSDGGFSPTTDQVNLINTPGVCFQPALPTDKSSGLTGEMIASCEDPTGNASRLFVSQDTDQDGRFWSLSTSNDLTQIGAEDVSSNYIQGITDFVAFKNEAWATNASGVVRVYHSGGGSALNTLDVSFFSFTNANVPHPALVFEDNLFFGDGSLLLRKSSSGAGAPATILTLPTGQIIVALGIDPGSGKMLISTIGQPNISDTINSAARVLYYNGFSNKVDKTVLVEQMITAFPASEGGVYAAYGNNLGYWNGAGVSFLRNFSNIGFNNDQLLYKQHFTNIGSTLYFIVRKQIYAHGPIRQNGDRIFYPAFLNRPLGNETDMTHIANVGSGVIGLSFATSKFSIWSTTSVSTVGTQALYSNEYEFKDMNDGAWIRRIKVFFKNGVATGQNAASFTFYNEDGIITTIGNSGVFTLANNSGATKALFEETIGGGTGLRVYQLAFRLVTSAVNQGVRRIEIYGDEANKE